MDPYTVRHLETAQNINICKTPGSTDWASETSRHGSSSCDTEALLGLRQLQVPPPTSTPIGILGVLWSEYSPTAENMHLTTLVGNEGQGFPYLSAPTCLLGGSLKELQWLQLWPSTWRSGRFYCLRTQKMPLPSKYLNYEIFKTCLSPHLSLTLSSSFAYIFYSYFVIL